MANITEAINMSFRVDKELKKQADTLFKSLGLNTSVALNMFLTQCVREQALPFTPSMKDEKKEIPKTNTVSQEITKEPQQTKYQSYYEDIL